ncbi:MAG: hypothetical protein ACK559_06530, partial [bacterium]
FLSFQKCTEVAEMQSELLKQSELQFPQYCRQVRTIRETCQELVNHFSLSFSMLVLQFELISFISEMYGSGGDAKRALETK